MGDILVMAVYTLYLGALTDLQKLLSLVLEQRQQEDVS